MKRGPKRIPIEKRYFKYVVKTDGCWSWIGNTNGRYGTTRESGAGGTSRYVHRLMWEWVNGEIPEGMLVCHTCDNPVCVNPDHLFLGTDKTNSDDKIRKGRHAYGERNAHTKLTEKQVLLIKDMRGKIRGKELARLFKVRRSCISRIQLGRRWKYLEIIKPTA